MFFLFLPRLSAARSTDADVAFGVAGGNGLGWFSVRNDTGEVVVRRPMDFETARQEEVWVKVFHRRRPLFFSAARLTVSLLNVNDNPPRFHESLVRASVQEEQYPPFYVAEVRADDADHEGGGGRGGGSAGRTVSYR